jgi:hypothetical protein
MAEVENTGKIIFSPLNMDFTARGFSKLSVAEGHYMEIVSDVTHIVNRCVNYGQKYICTCK